MKTKQNFEIMISKQDINLFKNIKSETNKDDRKSLLTIQNAIRNIKDTYIYLEIGSHLGGTIQPHLIDPRCKKIYSIDKRPAEQEDERLPKGKSYPYIRNTTERMLQNLRLISEKDLNKLECFDMDASEINKKEIVPKPDICFIDGLHTNKGVVSDFNFCSAILNENGAIIFHDLAIVSKAIKHILKKLKNNQINFRAYALRSDLLRASSIFVIEFGNCSIHQDPGIKKIRKKNTFFMEISSSIYYKIKMIIFPYYIKISNLRNK